MKITFIALILSFLIPISSSQEAIQNETGFMFRDKNTMVKLEFETGELFLNLEKPTKLKVSVENIDLKKSAIIGPGISMSGEQGKNYFMCVVTAHQKNLVDNNLEIKIYTKENKNYILINKFLIPVK